MKRITILFTILFALTATGSLMAQKALPYEYGFENNDLASEGWTLTSCHTGTGINTNSKKTGSYGFRFYYSSNPPQYLISPELTGGTYGIVTEFYYKNYSIAYPETFQVGYSTTTNSVQDFTFGDEITASDNQWTLYSNSFPSGTKYVAVKFNSNDKYYLYLDDFSFEADELYPQPKNLVVTTYTSSTATLNWTSRTGQDHWDIYYSTSTTAPDANTVPQVANTTTKPYTLTGLQAGETYYAYVRGNYNNGEHYSDWSNACSFEVGCFTPQNLQVPNVASDMAYITWTPAGVESSWQVVCSAVENFDPDNETPVTVSDAYYVKDGLISGTTYYVRVRANCGDGYSNWTPQVSFTPQCVAPVQLTVGMVGATSVRLSWNGMGTETIWQVSYSTDAGFNPDNGTIVEVNQDPCTVSNLSINTTYYACVRAKCSNVDHSNWTDAVSFTTSCAQPNSLKVNGVTATSATLAWTAVGDEDTWEISYSTIPDFNPDQGTIVEVSSNPYVLSNLTTGTAYYACVRSKCSASDQSAWSNMVSFTPYHSLTVNEGSAQDYFVPFYGYYTNSYFLQSQFIVPSVSLASLENVEITQLTFHTASYYSTVSWPNVEFKVYLATTEQTEFLSTTFVDWNTLDEVYSGNLSVSGNQMIVTFDTPFSYSGGNLLIGFNETTKSSSGAFVQWLGVSTSSNTSLSYLGYTTQQQFLPKMTIFYTIGTAPTCPKPTGLSINQSHNSAVLSWTAGGEESHWNVQYKLASATDWSEVIAVENTPTYTLSGLTPSTAYQVRVQADCGSGDVSNWLANGFTTYCGPYSAPYEHDFDSDATGSSAGLPQCWIRINDAEDPSNNYYPYVRGSNAYSGSNCLMFLRLYNSTALNQMAVLPEMDANVNTMQLSFYARLGSGTDQPLSVGVMTNPNDVSTFVKIEDVTITSDEYAQYNVNFDSYEGTGRFIVLKCERANVYNQIYVDNIVVTSSNVCLAPTNPQIGGITITSATFSWTPGGEETTWQVRYKKTADSDWSDIIDVSGTPTCNLSDLTPASDYQAQVRTVCGDNNYSIWKSVDFATACGATLPFIYDFSNDATGQNAAFPHCWTRVNDSESSDYNYYPFVVSSSSNRYLRFLASTNANAPTNQMAVLPEMSVDVSTLRMSFKSWLSSGNTFKTLTVGVMTDPTDASTFTKVADVVVRGSGSATYTMSFDGYSGAGRYIAFKCNKLTTGSNYSVFVDDIFVEVAPTSAPMDIPFTCDFEDAESGYDAFPPDGWHYSMGYYPFVYENSSYAHSGTKSLLVRTYDDANTCYAVLPPVDITNYPLNTLQMTFWARCGSGYSSLNIGVMTDPYDVSTYQSILTDYGGTASVTTTYKKFEVFFDQYTGDGQYIVIRTYGSTSCYIDDIEVSVSPTCRAPYDLWEGSGYPLGALVRWRVRDLEQTDYQISLSTTEGFNPDEGTIVDAEFEQSLVGAGTPYRGYMLTCLAPETTYYYYVRANCGNGDFSAWSDDYNSFTTLAACLGPYDFDVSYYSDVEASFMWYGDGGGINPEEWEFRYKKTSDVEWTTPSDFVPVPGSELEIIYTLTGLQPGTEYEAQLRQNCGPGSCPGIEVNYSEWASVTFTTQGSRNILYVTPTGAGEMNGTSWQNASNDLNAMLTLASTMEQKPVIWVADGVYTGDGIATNTAFTMAEGVDVYGSFDGTETEVWERDYVHHPTILDGQQVQRVLNQTTDFLVSTTWDGFIIQNGRTESGQLGAGACLLANSRMQNCIIRNNQASDNGGGIYASHATVVNCEVVGNRASQGGGIYSDASQVLNTTIVNNTATSRGGGLYAVTSDDDNTNLILWGNSAPNDEQYYNASLTYSAIQGSSIGGTGNIALNEENDGEGAGNYVRFIAPEFGIYQLQASSAVVGMGDNTVTSLPSMDLAGHDRITGDAIEPGAYEQYCTGYKYLPVNFAIGGSYDFYGTPLTEAGIYIHQFSFSPECDSIVVAEVSLNSIWYVTTTGAGTMDGSSWENASNDLNATLSYVAQQPGVGRRQVWVAEGTYAAVSTFNYVGGVEVHGGFAGNETELSQRDAAAHPTILSGTNSMVLLGPSSQYPCSEERPGLWEGFTLQGGHSIIVGDHFTLQNCTTSMLTLVSGTVKQCEFTGFIPSSYPYLMVELNPGAVMDSCQLHHNLFEFSLVRAEGAIIRYSMFYNNTHYSSGIYSWDGMYGTVLNAVDNVTIDHCDFLNNRIEYSSTISVWPFYNLESSSVNLLRQPQYTVIALRGSTMTNSIVWGNEQIVLTRNFIAKDAASEINYCAIEGGLYNGVGNICLATGNENGLFSVAFESPISGAGYLNASDEVDWSLKSNSICLKQGEDGSDIGAIASAAPATLSVVPSADHIIYVDVNGTGNGFSWADATPYLQYAVAHANTFEPAAQVWVKEGSYSSLVVDSLVAAFNVVNGVNVYGGFAGTESSLAERDIEAHPTYLDGQNAQRVLYQNEPLADGQSAVWDGFVIRNGFMARSHYYDYNSSTSISPYQNNYSYSLTQVHGAGAALMGNVTLSNTKFEGNSIALDASPYGYNIPVKGTVLSMCGGTLDHVSISYDTTAYVSSASSMVNSYLFAMDAEINNCDFSRNIGKIALTACSVNATRFENNQVRVELPELDDLDEATLYLDGSTISNSFIRNNNAVAVSRQFSNTQSANTYINCQIDHNNGLAVKGHSLAYNDTFINCNICDNQTNNMGAAWLISGGVFHNTVVWGNRDAVNMPVHFDVDQLEATCSFNHCAVELGIDDNPEVVSLASSNMGTSQAYAYPSFLAPDAGDYELTDASALIDAGDTGVNDGGYDIMGNDRVNNASVDIGAYEYKCVLYREYSDFSLGNTYPFYGEWLTESGQYVHRWAISPECDSVVVLNLSFKHIIYVTETGGGLMNGSSWENAFGDLRLATEAAGEHPYDRTQIWVAEGLYRGDGTSVNAFNLYPNVELYGGLTGTELADYDLSQRDLEHHVTILDGDYIQRVIYMVEDCTEATACVIDGFTIKNGFSRQDVDQGTALYLKRYAHVRNCKITENYTMTGVSAVWMKTDYIDIADKKVITNTFENCEITGNQGAYAVCSDHASFTNCKISSNDGYGLQVNTYTRLENCEFVSNGQNSSCRGHGILLAGNGVYAYKTPLGGDIISMDFLDMTNCLVKNNAGSGLHSMKSCGGHAETNIMSCVFDRNRATRGDDTRGGAIFNQDHDINISCSTIINNQASSDGGALYGTGYHIVNTILANNRAGGKVNQLSNHCYEVIPGCNMDGSDMVIYEIETTDIRYSAIEGGYPGEGNILINSDDLLLGLNGYQLRNTSVCVNQGTTEGITVPEYDLAGHSRVSQGRIDIGAYESDFTGRTLIQPDAHNIIYVSREGSETNDGSSWENATSHFQMALNLALTFDPKPQIWVKEGVYDNLDEENVQFWSDLAILPGLQVYGGFNGSEPATFNLDYRQFNNNLSILDGKNRRRVLEQLYSYLGDDRAVWDGFVIKNGYAQKGYTSNIQYLTEEGIMALFDEYMNGGGILLRDGASINNCDIYANTAFIGGGIYRENANANTPANYLRNNKIRRNYAITEGGGLYYMRGGDQAAVDMIANCEISGNVSDRHGALVAQHANLINCSIIGNKTEVYSFDTITSTNTYNRYVNCVLWGNDSRNYAFQTEGHDNVYEHCAIQGGHEGTDNINLAMENEGDDSNSYYPRFLDVDNEVYQPLEGSALVNEGDNASLYGEKDLAYHDRVKDGIVDLGAYEQACINYRHLHVVSNEGYDFYGQILNESGQYQYQWTPAGSDCDSLVSLDLEIRKIWYVKEGGSGTMEGSSWDNAMADINTALTAANNYNTDADKQVWVAKGTYQGDGTSPQAFRLRPNVELYGGFDGNVVSEDIDDRRPDTALTILSGSHCQRVIGNYGNESSFGPIARALVDGFVIQDGYTTGNGGGVYAANYVSVSNCVIKNNQGGNGAGLYLVNHCEATDCDIFGNTALYYGGGAYVSSSTLTYCHLHRNLCDNTATGNLQRRGGGIYGENATINNCLIANNSVLTDKAYGGGMYIGPSSVPSQLLNCTMVNNYSYNQAGGIYSENSGSNNEFINCILWGNRTDLNTQQVAVSGTNVPIYLRYCAVQGGCAGIGTITLPAENNSSSIYAPRFVRPSDNVGANYDDGDWHFQNGSILANHGERMTYTLTHDLDGAASARIKNDRVDIGAYESNTTNDYFLVPDAHNTIYVNAANTGGNLSGDSWANALPDLQMAINFAGDDDNHPKIWIAGGTYTSNGWPYVDAFVAMNGIDLYGGFAGNEPYDYDLANRDFAAHSTILDGQHIQRTLQQAKSEYFKYRRIETLQSATYDGLTIRNGFAYKKDGGNVLMYKGDLRNCIIENGHTLDGEAGGGGIRGYSGVHVFHTVFRNNKAEDCGLREYSGGGAGLGAIVYRDCLFANNSALNCSHGGGATEAGTHYNSTIVNNYATHSGGGVYSGHIYNSILWGNKVGDNIPCSLTTNNVDDYNAFNDIVLTVRYSAVEGGYAGEGNITLNASNTGNADINYPMFVEPSIAAGANYSGGNWNLQDGSVCVNHGSNSYVNEGELDLNYEVRIQNETVDMGCFETPYDFDFEIVPDAANIIYVTQNGAGLKDGSSWANATPYLQFALERATLYTPKPQIWMAEGVYSGDGVPYHPAFQLTPGISIHGGFAGNEPSSFDLTQRDFDTHITVLDGQNMQQILRRDYSDAIRLEISGITFQNGRSERPGGAAHLSLTDIDHCKFINNSYVGEHLGGGALNAVSCDISYCEFMDNYSSYDGGAIYNYGVNVFNWCIVKNNTAAHDGGGVYRGCELYNSEISYNEAGNKGGGIMGYHKMKNCTVVKNVTTSGNDANAGGIYLSGASGGLYSVANNIIWGNRAGAIVSNLRGTNPPTDVFVYNAVERDEIFPMGTGNIMLQSDNDGSDPGLYYVRFEDPDGENFRLYGENPQSMCIDAGRNDYAAPGDYDLDGNERFRNGVVDMGCYEQTPVDCHMPTNLNIPEEYITFTTAEVNWTPGADESEWMVYYMQVGATTPYLVTVDTNYIQLQDLHPNDRYMVKVRSVCSAESMSSYCVAQYFNTACDPDSIYWPNEFTEAALLPANDQDLPSNSNVLFNWDYIEGADYYDLYLWRTDHGNGLDIPTFPVRKNLHNNYATVDLAVSYYDGYGQYAHCPGWGCDPEPPLYLYQNDTTDVAYYAWYVVAHKDCATIQSDTMFFNTGLPDLHVTALDCSYAQTGQLMTVQWSVRNDGTVATPTGATWTDYIVLSYPINWTTESFTGNDPESFVVAEVPNLIALNPNMQYTNQYDVFIPNDMYGSVFLFVLSNWQKYSDMHLDFAPYGGVFPNPYTPDPSGYPYYYMEGTCATESFHEIVECDNFFYKHIEVDIPPYPDLIAREVITPYESVAGDSITISWKIINQGAAGFENQPVTDIVYMTTDTVYSASVITVGSFTDTVTMAIGDTITRFATFPTNERDIDTFNFFVRVDANNLVYESLFEGNNISPVSEHSTILLPAPPPDLTVTTLSLGMDTVSPYEQFHVTYEVQNIGFVEAKPDLDNYPPVNDSCGVAPPWRGTQWVDKMYLSNLDTLNTRVATSIGQVSNDTILYTLSQLPEVDTLFTQWARCHFAVPDTLSANASHQDSVNYYHAVRQAELEKAEFLRDRRRRNTNSYTINGNARTPRAIQEGMYYFYVFTDASDAVFEHECEENNIRMDSVYVVQPDLIVTHIAIDSTRQYLTYTLANIGEGRMIDERVMLKAYFNNSIAGEAYLSNFNLASQGTFDGVMEIEIPCNFYEYNSLRLNVNPLNDKDFTNNNLIIENYRLSNPDFLADELIAPVELNSGDSFDVVYDITNMGDTLYQGNVDVGVYLGLSPELNFITATRLDLEEHSVSLGVGEDTTIVQNVTLPIEAEGQYYLYVVVNDGNSICEGDNVYSNYIVSNMIDVTLSPYPDLYVIEANTPEGGTAGSTVTVSYTATNQGIRAVNETERWTDAIYVSNVPTFDPETATLLADISHVGPLAIGETYMVERTVMLPANLANDNYFIFIQTDKSDQIFEYVGEYNNVYQSASFPVQEYSLDLAVTSVTGETELEWDQTVTYTYTVHNYGTRPTVESYFDRIYLSADATLDESDLELRRAGMGNLAGGASYTNSLDVVIPYGYTGNYYILMTTDAEGRNPDSNPENNVMALSVSISAIPVPDLEVSEVTILTEYPACGQPIEVRFKVSNVGDGPTYGTYVDRAVYSLNTYNAGTQFASITRSDTLQPGDYYYDTLSFVVPVPNTGNYAVYIKTNSRQDLFELNYENNLGMVGVVIGLNAPGDFVVTEINRPSSVTAGDVVTISWKVRNLGPNVLEGVGYSDVVYLSTDTIFDSDDKLLDNLNFSDNLSFPLYTDIEHSLTTTISGVQEGDYYIIVLADARNTFYELNENNNRGVTMMPMHVELPILPFNTPVAFDLTNFQYKDFKLPVGNNISETVRIYVRSNDSIMGAVNNIYVLKDGVGTNLDYDISTDGQMTSNSELYIARTEAGYYGVSVFGYSPVNDMQHIIIEADILPFEVRSITPNIGGNTGKVTVKLIGSKFRYDMPVWLEKINGNDSVVIHADTLRYVNFNEAFATFDLTGADLGVYTLGAYNYCADTTKLVDCFTVVEGEPENLATNLIIPVGLRANRYCMLTLEYGNIGNTDIVNPRIVLRSEGGSWIGLRRGELNIHRTELEIPVITADEPDGILRPGVRHTVTIYCYTSGELHFYINVNDEIDVHEYIKNIMMQ